MSTYTTGHDFRADQQGVNGNPTVVTRSVSGTTPTVLAQDQGVGGNPTVITRANNWAAPIAKGVNGNPTGHAVIENAEGTANVAHLRDLVAGSGTTQEMNDQGVTGTPTATEGTQGTINVCQERLAA